MIADKLYKKAVEISPVCVGLDSQIAYVPGCIRAKDISEGEKIFEFNRQIIDAVYENVACFKVQVAYYEALGIDGMRAYAKTLQYIRKKGAIAIADVKRGDISSTATQYAKGHFEGDFESDYMTLNAYMGQDAISPYYPYLKEKNKGLFLLLKTSNPSSSDFQDVLVGKRPFYELVAEKIEQWGEAFIGSEGFSAVGAVVGLTYPSEFLRIVKQMPHTFFLIPGYGAQGGTGKDIAQIFQDKICGVVNSSRGLIMAHQGKTEDTDFVEYIQQAVMAMKEDIVKWL